MIVVDASAVLDLLLATPRMRLLIDRLLKPSETLHAPELLDLEIAQVVRRYERTRSLAPREAAEVIRDFIDLPIERHSHELLLARVWDLRRSLTAYDAAYVALAELLDAPLVTTDRRLARSSGHEATIELVR